MVITVCTVITLVDKGDVFISRPYVGLYQSTPTWVFGRYYIPLSVDPYWVFISRPTTWVFGRYYWVFGQYYGVFGRYYGVFYIAPTISSGKSICISISFAPLILEYPSFISYVNLILLPSTNASIFLLTMRICFAL